MDMQSILSSMFEGVTTLTWQQGVMYAIGLLLIYLAIKKDYEPMLLLPIGFGAILVNLPFSTVLGHDGNPGFLQILYNAGIITELFPILIFIAVGAMIDFSQLLKSPKMLLFGAAAQFGIFFTILAALGLSAWINDPEIFSVTFKEASAIGIIGAADGPTSIFVAQKFATKFIGPITVAAYSYMALVPIIQPPVIKALTTKKERLIRMAYTEKRISKPALIMFPIVITLVAGILAPESASLVGSLMFGNLIRECGVLEKLSKTAQNELANLVTLLLGITIGSTMQAEQFVAIPTMIIMGLGLFAFIFDTAGGVLFAKFLNMVTKEKINPMVGAAGISAFPMAARIVQKMAKDEDPTNFVLMQSISANVSGQLGSVIAGGMILTLVPKLIEMFNLPM